MNRTVALECLPGCLIPGTMSFLRTLPFYFRICEDKVMHVVEKICWHLLTRHSGMTLRTYYDKHVESRKRPETIQNQIATDLGAGAKKQRTAVDNPGASLETVSQFS